MKKQEKIEEKFDRNLFAKAVEKKPVSKASLWKTVRDLGGYETNPSFMEKIEVPEGTEYSPYDPAEAKQMLVEMYEEEKEDTHACYNLEKLTMYTPVVIHPTQVIQKAKVYKVKLGLLTEDVYKATTSISSTLLSYFTNCKDETEKVTRMRFDPHLLMPNVDFVLYRKAMKVWLHSPLLTRDLIYKKVIKSPDDIFFVHSAVGDKFPNYKVNETLSQAFDQTIKVATTQVDVVVAETNKIDGLHTLNQLSQSARGGDAGRGSLTAGYEIFEMTPKEAKVINMIRDFTNIMQYTNSLRLVLSKEKVPIEVIKSLSCTYAVCVLDAPSYPRWDGIRKTGIYSIIDTTEDIITYYHVDAHEVNPRVMTGKVDYQQVKEKNTYEIMKYKTNCFAYMPITPYVRESDTMKMYPASAADKCSFIMVSSPRAIKSVTTLGELVYRSMIAISFRNKFPITRNPFYSHDTSKHVHWERPILYPANIIKKKDFDFSQKIFSNPDALPSDLDVEGVLAKPQMPQKPKKQEQTILEKTLADDKDHTIDELIKFIFYGEDRRLYLADFVRTLDHRECLQIICKYKGYKYEEAKIVYDDVTKEYYSSLQLAKEYDTFAQEEEFNLPIFDAQEISQLNGRDYFPPSDDETETISIKKKLVNLPLEIPHSSVENLDDLPEEVPPLEGSDEDEDEDDLLDGALLKPLQEEDVTGQSELNFSAFRK